MPPGPAGVLIIWFNTLNPLSHLPVPAGFLHCSLKVLTVGAAPGMRALVAESPLIHQWLRDRGGLTRRWHVRCGGGGVGGHQASKT